MSRYNKCHETKITSVATSEVELECSGSETLTCEIKSHVTETVTHASSKPVTYPVTKNGETFVSTSYSTVYSEETITYATPVSSVIVVPSESGFVTKPEAEQSTVELTTVAPQVSIPSNAVSSSSSSPGSTHAISTGIEGAANKVSPMFTFFFGFLLSIICLV
ncbi:unnamed protein product [[Candida] boidinii]|nr:unnamed protein product [[Candida] boidinii]